MGGWPPFSLRPREGRLYRKTHGSPQLGLRVDLAHRVVVEAQTEHEALEWLDRAWADRACAGAHGSGTI